MVLIRDCLLFCLKKQKLPIRNFQFVNRTAVVMIIFKGNFEQIGSEYGKAFTGEIHKNISILVRREGYEPLPLHDSDFISWRKQQESILSGNWSWLLEEMSAVGQMTYLPFSFLMKSW